LTFILLTWQGFGGGLTATAWQSLMAKVFPVRLHGTFFGVQSSAFNLFSAFAAILAGLILSSYWYPLDFTLCFLLAGIAMVISFIFLAMTKEEKTTYSQPSTENNQQFRQKLRIILRKDRDFRWYLVARTLTQFATMGFAFYTIYAVKEFGVDERLIGVLTGILLFTEVIMNPIMGWIGDRRGHLITIQMGMVATIASVLLAWGAQNVLWFFPVFILAGIANIAAWVVPLSMTLEFGSESQRPTYIGLANTLIAPSTFLAPVLAGWLIDKTTYQVAFLAAALAGVATLVVLLIGVTDPRKRVDQQLIQTASK
jgi:MFS family permease